MSSPSWGGVGRRGRSLPKGSGLAHWERHCSHQREAGRWVLGASGPASPAVWQGTWQPHAGVPARDPEGSGWAIWQPRDLLCPWGPWVHLGVQAQAPVHGVASLCRKTQGRSRGGPPQPFWSWVQADDLGLPCPTSPPAMLVKAGAQWDSRDLPPGPCVPCGVSRQSPSSPEIGSE